jgi:hypothetical protein
MIDTRLRWPGVVGLAAYLALPAPPQWPESTPRSKEHVVSAAILGADNTAAAASDSDAEFVEKQTVCVGSRGWSAGELGNSVLYRVRRSGRKVEIGYFVYWSTERPWGNNALSYAVLPALLTDAFYSHFLYVFPGVKDYLYGAGDIEGASVEFQQRPDGSLEVEGGRSDNGTHHPVVLSRSDLVDHDGRVVLLTDVWSHQLGAHGGAAFANGQNDGLKCYGRGEIHPLTDNVAQTFRLGDVRTPRRAKPAWVTATDDDRVASR